MRLGWVGRIGVACAALCILGGCKSKWGFDPIAERYLDTPHVNGIWIYNADGIAVGSWGQPWVPPSYYAPPAEIRRVYPNPAVAVSTNISFATPESGRTWLWVVRAIGPAEVESLIVRSGGATVPVPGGMPAGILFDGESLPAGTHSVPWNAADRNGQQLPSGFYRVFLHFEGDSGSALVAIKDILFLLEQDCASMPWELRKYLSCWPN